MKSSLRHRQTERDRCHSTRECPRTYEEVTGGPRAGSRARLNDGICSDRRHMPHASCFWPAPVTSRLVQLLCRLLRPAFGHSSFPATSHGSPLIRVLDFGLGTRGYHEVPGWAPTGNRINPSNYVHVNTTKRNRACLLAPWFSIQNPASLCIRQIVAHGSGRRRLV